MDPRIAQLGEDILRGPTRPVKGVTEAEVQRVASDLLAIVGPAQGVGIAANQIRNDLRIFVMASHPNERYPYAPDMEPMPLINPVLLAHSEEQEKDWEGCLSVAATELRGLVPRWKWVEVEYTTLDGQHKHERYEGFLARIFQHELDHLDGLVYLDRLESSRDLYTRTVFEQRLADRARDQRG